jgi:uncharacterized Zn finger protein (UPF0148 family)
MTTSFHCTHCGAPLKYEGGPQLTVQCTFCSSTMVVPEELVRAWQAAHPVATPTSPSSTPQAAVIDTGKLLDRTALHEQLHDMREKAREERRTLRRQARQARRQS